MDTAKLFGTRDGWDACDDETLPVWSGVSIRLIGLSDDTLVDQDDITTVEFQLVEEVCHV